MTSLPNYPKGSTYVLSSEGLSNHVNRKLEPKFPGQHAVWTDDVTVELPVRVGKSGLEAEKPSTLIEEWQRNQTLYAKEPALSVKRNKQWVTLTYEEYHYEATRFAKALLALGLPDFTGINIIGFNAPEWVIAYSGSAFARCIPVGIYSTNSQ
jgi:long-chain-fatty-acid--CoA ligase ACSBG